MKKKKTTKKPLKQETSVSLIPQQHYRPLQSLFCHTQRDADDSPILLGASGLFSRMQGVI